MSHLADQKKKSEKGSRLLNKGGFTKLIGSIREEFATENYSNNSRVTVLQALLRLKLADESILNDTVRLIKMDKMSNVNQLTNVLYVLAKFKWH